MTQPTPYGSTSIPGRTLGIVGFIVDFFVAPLGLILSIIAKVQSRRAGVPNGLATAGIIVGAIFTVGDFIAVALIVLAIVALGVECANLGHGTHFVNGVHYTCS